MVIATGGTGPYNYEIIDNTCGLSNRSLQPSSIFLNLTACTYTIWVMDAGGQFATRDVTVGGNYTGPSASMLVDGCGFAIAAKNGSPPLSYSISTDGGKTYGPASGQTMYSGLSNGTYFVKIEDTCNSTFITTATIALDTLEYQFSRVYRTQVIDSIAPNMITGGQGPFKFFIVNGTDTLRSNNNVFAMKDIVKTCSTLVVIQSACGRYVNPFTYTDAELVCLNYSNGTAEIKVNLGVAPYTSYYYPSSSTSISIPGLLLNGLPENEIYYSFGLKDNCNHFASLSYEALYRFRPSIFFKTSTSCNPLDSLHLDIFQDNYYVKTRYAVECSSCKPVQQFNNIEKSVSINNLNSGIKTITIRDSCGTIWTCTSQFLIPINERCDFIQLTLINAFICDNRPSGYSISGDTLPVDMYYLRTDAGLLIDSNTQGKFSGLINGSYKLQAKSAGCGLIESNYFRNITIQAPDYRIGFLKRNGDCQTRYILNVDFTYFPYTLSDTAGHPIISSSANSQFGVTFEDIKPGKYILKSLLNCWQQEINLPEIHPKLKQENLTICPAGGSITISGGKSFHQWQEYYQSIGLNLNYTNQISDWYSLGSRESKFNYDTATHTYFNIEPGKSYTIYLHSFASVNYDNLKNTCPVDSLTIMVPQYIPPAVVADLIIECDDSQSALFQLKIKNGTSPFRIQELDCKDQSDLGSSLTTRDSLVDLYSTNYSSGMHCFKVTDVCQNSSQAESTTGEQLKNIQSLKNCDTTSTFYYTKIPGATYNWSKNSDLNIGDSAKITIADPRPGDEIKLQVNYKGCAVRKSLKIDSLTLKKFKVRIEANKALDLCDGDSILLNASITGGNDPLTYTWSNGSGSNQVWIKTTGIQTLKARNGIGCMDSSQINIRIGSPLQLSFSQKNIACFGDSTGSIKINPSGGIQPYGMLWSDGSKRDSISRLIAGNYRFTLTDIAGCVLSTEYNLTQNTKLNIASSNQVATCLVSLDGSILANPAGGIPPYRYLWNTGQTTSQLTRLNPGNYQVTVTDQVSCQAIANIEVRSGPQILKQRTDTLCAGMNLRIGNSIYTVTGNYRDTLKTIQGCDSIVLTNLKVNAPLQYSMVAVNPICSGQSNGTITLSDIQSKPPYSFSLNGKNITGFKADQLASGNYIIRLTDGFGCFTEKGAALSNPKRIELDAGRDSLLKIGDSILLRVITNLNPSEIKYIQWSSDLGLICSNCTSTNLKPKKDLSIKVELENTSGCKITDQFIIRIDNEFKVFAPNILYLNPLSGNDQNSRFTLFSDQQILEIEYLRIFDRTGTLIFEGNHILPGDLQAGWDGSFKNKPVDSGVYVFLAKIRFADESSRIKSGDITVIR